MGKCMYCGKQFKDNDGPVKKIYCSDACRSKWNKENTVEQPRKRYTFYCAYCGKQFETDHESDYCCSKKCKKKYNDSKKPDGLTKDAIEARKLGLTYGEYKARDYWKVEGPRMRARMLYFKEKLAEEKRKKNDNDE